MLGQETPAQAMGSSFKNLLQKGKTHLDRRIHCEYRSGNYKAFPKQKDLPSRMQRHLNYKYVYTHGIVDQLYQVEKDPDELNNLALSPEFKDMVQQKRFETLANWRFDQYKALKVKTLAEGNEEKKKRKGQAQRIQWEAHPHAKSYTVFFSDTADHTMAKPISKEQSQTTFQCKDPGYYWVMAEPHYTRTSRRFPNRPVLVADHSFTLPISDALKIDMN
jgi:hypothetical protein